MISQQFELIRDAADSAVIAVRCGDSFDLKKIRRFDPIKLDDLRLAHVGYNIDENGDVKWKVRLCGASPEADRLITFMETFLFSKTAIHVKVEAFWE